MRSCYCSCLFTLEHTWVLYFCFGLFATLMKVVVGWQFYFCAACLQSEAWLCAGAVGLGVSGWIRTGSLVWTRRWGQDKPDENHSTFFFFLLWFLSRLLQYMNADANIGCIFFSAGWAVCGGLLPQSSVADLWHRREDAKPRCLSIRLLTDTRGLGSTGNILQPAWLGKLQVKSISYCLPLIFCYKVCVLFRGWFVAYFLHVI